LDLTCYKVIGFTESLKINIGLSTQLYSFYDAYMVSPLKLLNCFMAKEGWFGFGGFFTPWRLET